MATILARVLSPAARQRVLDRLVPFLAAAAVVAFAMGSSSVPEITRVGHSLRWAVLALLLVAAALWNTSSPRVRAAAVGAAAALVGLAVLSSAWSVEPRTSFERGVSLGLLFCTCLLLANAAAGRPDRVVAVFTGLLAGAVVVGLAGLVLLGADHGRAVAAASYESPARYRGFGQDPNTVALLFAVATPLAVWALVRPGRRALAAGALLLFAGTIVASGSRGALAAAGVGACVVLVVRARRLRRIVPGVGVAVVLVVAGVGIQTIPKPSSTASSSTAAPVRTGPRAKPGYVNAEQTYPLNADVGQPLPGGGQPPVRRSFFSSSGRVVAWGGALHEVARRPLVGHGFGTEQDVFVDRYYQFVGGLPENSYIGLALQLGVAGLVALVALVAALVTEGLRSSRRDLAAAGLGVLAAGLAVAVVQSYIYSVGNIAAAAVWIPAFLAGARLDA